MSSTNSEEHNDSWAVQLFRPVLKDLNIQNLDNQTYLFSSNYRALHRFHMDRCIVVVKKFHFSKDNYKGVFIWRYLKKQNVFILYIILSDSMYRNDLSKDEKIYRKAVTTHEFIHCVAALLTTARLDDPNLIENQNKKLSKRFHAIETNDISNLMADINMPLQSPQAYRFLSFPDAHFRTGDEEYDGKYSVLYRNMLISYDLVNDYFSIEDKKKLKSLLSEDKTKAGELLIQLMTKIAQEKNLDLTFVYNRFIEEFIPKIQSEINNLK